MCVFPTYRNNASVSRFIGNSTTIVDGFAFLLSINVWLCRIYDNCSLCILKYQCHIANKSIDRDIIVFYSQRIFDRTFVCYWQYNVSSAQNLHILRNEMILLAITQESVIRHCEGDYNDLRKRGIIFRTAHHLPLMDPLLCYSGYQSLLLLVLSCNDHWSLSIH